MSPPPIHLHAVVHGSTATAAAAVREAFDAAGGVVVGARQLGGLALVFDWELDDASGGQLTKQLAERGVAVDRESIAELDLHSATKMRGTLHVVLVHDGPDEKMVVPAVPG